MTETRPPTPESIGDYRIDGPLGVGGMGEVFRAWDPDLERHVAIKLIRSEASKHAAALERFRREALVIAKLDHPSIVRIHHIQKWQGHPCLVMELVDGEPLAQVLKRGPLPIDQTVRLLQQIASGLSAAHAEGIVHRDLKAQNVMLTPEGRAKILDFGIAKRLQGDEETLSHTGAIIGTLHTMSPEQAAGKPVDGRADLFALGVLAYEMLSGKSPFRAQTAGETLARIISHYPRPVSDLAPDVPKELSDLVASLLSKAPEDRPATALDVATWLEDRQDALQPGSAHAGFSQTPSTAPEPKGNPEPPSVLSNDMPTLVAGRPNAVARAAPPTPAPLAEPLPEPSTSSHFEDTAAPSPHRSWITLAAVAVLLVSLGLLYWTSMGPRPPLTVAVAGLAPEDPAAAPWQSTALEEGLILSLQDHPQLRSLDGTSMAHLRRVLGHPIGLELDALEGFRENLSKDLADVLATGSWQHADDQWHLNLYLQRAESDVVQELQEEGRTLAEVTHRMAHSVAAALGRPPVDDEEGPQFSALLPSHPETLRAYADGLRAQRSGDVTSARSHFKEALTLSPQHAEVHRAYAAASNVLGFESDAEEAANKALELSQQLPDGARDAMRAVSYSILGNSAQAITTYDRLFAAYPDEIAFAVEAARLRMLSDDRQAALEPIARLRPQAGGSYAGHLDLTEARIHIDAGAFTQAADLARQSATLGENLHLPYLEAEGHFLLGIAQSHLGERDAAEASIERAYLTFQRIGNVRKAFDALLENAFLLFDQGEVEQALEYLKRYQERFAARDEPWSRAMVEANMAPMLIYQGRLEDARNLLQSAVETFEARGNLLDLAQTLLNLGAAHHLGGNLNEALSAYERAEPLFEQFGDRPNLASVRINIGEVQHANGELDLANSTYAEALNVERQLGRPADISYALNRLGELALLQGSIEPARGHFEESLGLVEPLGNPWVLAQAQFGLAQVELAASNAGRAQDLAAMAKQHALDAEDVPTSHRADLLRAQALLQSRPPDLSLAQEIYDNVHVSTGQIEDWRLRVETDILAARLAIEQGTDPKPELRTRLEALVEDSDAAGSVLDAFEVRLTLSEVELTLGDAEAGRQLAQQVLDVARAQGWTRYAQQAARLLDR